MMPVHNPHKISTKRGHCGRPSAVHKLESEVKDGKSIKDEDGIKDGMWACASKRGSSDKMTVMTRLRKRIKNIFKRTRRRDDTPSQSNPLPLYTFLRGPRVLGWLL